MNPSAVRHRATREDCVVIAGAAALSVLAAYWVVRQPEFFNLAGVASARGFAVVVAGLVLGGFSLRFPDVALCCLVAFVALNLSDVLVRGHGLPSLLQLSFVPLALAGWWNAPHGTRFPPLTLTLPLCGYLVVVLWSTTIAVDPAAADVRLLEHVRGFAVFVVVVMLAQSAGALRRALWTFVLCVSLLGVLALVQVLTGDFTREFGGLARIKYAQVYGTTFEPRIAGPLGDPNFFAQVLVTAVPMALYLAWTAGDVRRRALGFGAAGVVGAATLFTYSRGGALALGVVLAACVLTRGINLRKASFGAVPVLMLLWIAMPDDFARRLTTLNQLLPGSDDVLRPDSSFGERRLFAAAAWRMFEDAPFLGVGAGNYGVHFIDYAQRVGSDARLYVTPTEGYYPHNLYLEVAAETGVVGLLLFASALAMCFLHLWRARIRLLAAAHSSAGLVTGCGVALIGYLLTSVFLHGHFIRYWWLLVGFAIAAQRLTPDAQQVHQERATPMSSPVPCGSWQPTGRSQSGDGATGPALGSSDLRPAIAVIVSRFPLITETFILREIIEMERQGQPVLLVPLLRERTAVVHREAEPWIARALYTPFVSMPILFANVRMLIHRPGRYLLAFWQILVGTVVSPNFLIRSLALFPKAVFLAERLEHEGIRHLHAHYATHPATAALIISSLTEITFSFTVHAHDIFVRRTMLRRKLEAAAFVRSISEFNRSFLARRYSDHIACKVHVIHVGIDPDIYVCASRGQLASARPEILCVASLQRYKGLPVLIDACRRLRERDVELACTIVGEGPMRPALERQIRDLGLEHVVTLAGARPQHEVASLMRRASLFVIPSVVAPDGQMEGIPVALMEAMASRLPVVASSLSGIPEAVEHGTTGLLVAPGSAPECALAIERVLSNQLASRQMGDRARAAIERRFRLDDCVMELLRRIDRCNPPPDDAQVLRLPALQAGGASGTIGLRRLQERRDSRIAHLLVPNGRAPHEVVLKIHKSRQGESRSCVERARKEFDLLHSLRRAAVTGSSVPRPLYLDETGAGVLMESCRGESLDALIRACRLTREVSRKSDLTSAMRRTGTWLRHFQATTTGSGDPALALERLVVTCARHLEACRGDLLPSSATTAVRLQLDALKTRLAPESLRLTRTHQDFWPGNVFVAGEIVEVIDFEGTDEGLPYEDVAYFLVQLEQFFPGVVFRSQFRPLGSAFLAGYLPENHGFDWAAFELCRIAAALKMLSSTKESTSGLRARWQRRMLRGIIVGEAA